MRKIFTFMVVAVFVAGMFFVSVSDAVDIYTFKKDRVDQDLEGGNRGYIYGSPPPADKDRDLKRTLIGVDIELPGTAEGEEEEGYTPPPKKEVKKKTPVTIERKTAEEAPPVKEGASERRKALEKETEEDWIK